jgi:rod shape-determining protein MreD
MKLGFVFFLGLLALIINTVFFPSIRLFFFAPTLAIVFLNCSRYRSFWWAIVCGMFMDLFTTEIRFGLFSLGYCLTAAVAWPQKSHFFEENPYSISLYTAVISSLFSGIFFILLFIFGKASFFSWKSTLIDLFAMPFVDAIYAFCWFTCPLFLYNHLFKNQVDKPVVRNN